MDAWRGDAVIVDVDGTLVDVKSIRHHVVPGLPGWAGRKDFDAFHRASVWCPPITSTVQALEEHWSDGLGIIVVTARMEMWRAHTHGWYESHVTVPYDVMHMRADFDGRPDAVVKGEIYERIVRDGWNVVRCYDDNPSVVDLWRSLGIPTTVVPGWVG